MSEKLILAHDLGTSGNKASLYSADGQLVASAVCSYETHYSHGTWAEQDPNDWWSAVCSTTSRIMEGRDPKSVVAVAFSGQSMGCLCLDKNGTPLTNSIIWQDSRATKEADLLTERIGGLSEGCRITGQQLSANYIVEKLMWIKEHQPEIYRDTFVVLPAKDYIAYRMTGNFTTDHTDAAFSQMYDMQERKLSAALLDASGIDGDKFPKIVPSTAIVGEVTSQAAAELGIAAGTPVVAGAGDGPCAALGAGAIEAGDAYACVGTSTWLSYVIDEYTYDPYGRLQLQPLAVDGKYVLAGTMQAGGLSYHWARKQFFNQPISYQEINEMIEKSPAGANGVLYLPYLMGERSPWWNTKARGAFIGLRGYHEKSDMLRAVLEGVAMNMKLIYNDISHFRSFGKEMNMIGGGAKGSVWRQIFADMFGMTIHRPQTVEEATSFGAVMIAAVGVGLFPNFQEAKKLIKIEATNEPNMENHAVYEELLQIFEDTYHALEPINDRLAK